MTVSDLDGIDVDLTLLIDQSARHELGVNVKFTSISAQAEEQAILDGKRVEINITE